MAANSGTQARSSAETDGRVSQPACTSGCRCGGGGALRRQLVERRLLDDVERLVHVLGGRRRVQHADPEGLPAEESRRGDVDVARPLDGADERRVDGVDAALVGHARRPPAQRDDAELDRRQELELVARLDARGRLTRQVERLVDGGAERRDARTSGSTSTP